MEWDDDFNPGLGNELTSITASPNGNVTAVGYADAEFSLYAIQYDANGNTNWTFPDVFEGYKFEDYDSLIADLGELDRNINKFLIWINGLQKGINEVVEKIDIEIDK